MIKLIKISVYKLTTLLPFVVVEGCGGASLYDAPAHEIKKRVKGSITFTRKCGLWHISKRLIFNIKNKLTNMWQFVAYEVAYEWKTKT